MPILHVQHHKQRYQSDCLASCAAMMLSPLGVNVRYQRLMRLLNVQPGTGASIYNLRYLNPLNVSVQIQDGDMDYLASRLNQAVPVLAAVDTVDLPGWSESTDHAVVVVGIDDSSIMYHDPWFDDGLYTVNRVQFESAWLYHDYVCATIHMA